jgi:hypothetical protein
MNLYFAAFLIIPIVILVAKESGRLSRSPWLIFFSNAVIGWLLIILAVDSSQRSLDDIVRHTTNPSDELLKQWQNDGATQVFALYFGWIYAIVYFLISYSVVKLGAVIIKKISN